MHFTHGQIRLSPIFVPVRSRASAAMLSIASSDGVSLTVPPTAIWQDEMVDYSDGAFARTGDSSVNCDESSFATVSTILGH